MPTLRLVSRGSAVIDLQRRLATAWFSAGTADGVFGSRTDRCRALYQRARGLGADGVVGPQTWSELLGTTTAPHHARARITLGPAEATIPSGVLISANAVRVLEDILRAARVTRATVTGGAGLQLTRRESSTSSSSATA